MTKPESKTSRRFLDGAERQQEAVRLRKQRLPYARIAEMCGYSDESGARKAVENALAKTRETTAETAEELRQLDLVNLDELERLAMVAARKAAPQDEDGEDVPPDMEALASATLAVIRIQQRRAKLMGLDAAEQFDISNTGVDPLARLDGALARLGDRLGKAERGEAVETEDE